MCSACGGDYEGRDLVAHGHLCPECEESCDCDDPGCQSHYLKLCQECVAKLRKEEAA
jgi:hypothetical protein